MPLLTFGHGTLAIEAFLELVRRANIECVIDVRSVPKSHRNPQFRREAMSEWLRDAGILYDWLPELGGFRRPKPDSRNSALWNSAFRGYADYMQTPAFWEALDGVLRNANEQRAAIMCSESLW
jgi:uncharacterized protein (DUF488 family)